MTQSEKWRIWGEDSYGNLLYRRATGELPEMESAKAAAKLLKKWVKPGDRILDVGCGAGHYYRSIRREIDVPFSYAGVDATESYIALAQKAWQAKKNVSFQTGDVFALPFKDGEFDIVLSCNLFLHLPSIHIPISEVTRVAKRHVLIRTLVGERSFRIQDIASSWNDVTTATDTSTLAEFDANGEPIRFAYFNIYSRNYVSKLISGLPGVQKFEITPDDQFDPAHITRETTREDASINTTRMIGGWQVNGYILEPWAFILIDKK